MAPLMSITSRSNRHCGWLPVLIAVATGTGGTFTWRVTVSEAWRQPPGQTAVAEEVGVTGLVGDWVGETELDRVGPGGVDEVVEHEAAPAAATAITVIRDSSLGDIRRMAAPPLR